MVVEKDLLAGLGSSLIQFLMNLPSEQKKALAQVLNLSLTSEPMPDLDAFYEGVEESLPTEGFIAEAEGIVAAISAQWEIVRSDATDKLRQATALTEIFREVHQIKGLAALFGFNELCNLALLLENYFEGLRLGNLPLTEEVFALFKRCFDAMQNSLHESPGQIGLIPELQFLEAELSNLSCQRTNVK